MRLLVASVMLGGLRRFGRSPSLRNHDASGSVTTRTHSQVGCSGGTDVTAEQKDGQIPPTPFSDLGCRSRKAAAFTISAVYVLAAVFAGAVHAADDAGIYDFIRSQAHQSRSDAAPSSPLRHAQPIVPMVAPHAARHVREPAFREPKAQARQLAREPRARFASLPRVEERATVRSAMPPLQPRHR